MYIVSNGTSALNGDQYILKDINGNVVSGLTINKILTDTTSYIHFNDGIIEKNGQIFNITDLSIQKNMLVDGYNILFYNLDTQNITVVDNINSQIGICADGEFLFNSNFINSNIILGGFQKEANNIQFIPKILVNYDVTDQMIKFIQNSCCEIENLDSMSTSDFIGLVSDDNLKTLISKIYCCTPSGDSCSNSSASGGSGVSGASSAPLWEYSPQNQDSNDDFLFLQNSKNNAVEYIKLPTLKHLRDIFGGSKTDAQLLSGYNILKFLPSVTYSPIVTESIQENRV